MSASTRITVSVALRERQLIETIRAIEAVDLSVLDVAGQEALSSALDRFRAALQRLQERLR